MTSRMECSQIATVVGAFVDGALDTVRTLEVEEHLGTCDDCRERAAFERAVRGSLQRAVHSEVPAPSMKDKWKAAMLAAAEEDAIQDAEFEESKNDADAEDDDELPARVSLALVGKETERASAQQAERAIASAEHRAFSWRTMTAVAVAASLMLVWNVVSHQAPPARSSSAIRAGFGSDPLADIVSEHSRPLPPERTDPREVRAFERYVGVPVHPPRLPKPNTRLIGGRVLALQHERAAMLQYEVGQGQNMQRVSVFIYDPRRIQVGGDEMSPRTVGTAQVRVGRSEGYSVAVTQRQGVGYAVASDLDTEASAELAGFNDED